MRLPNFCNRPTPRAPCRSFGSRITALLGFRRGVGLPRRPPGRNLGRQCDRVKSRLTPRRKLCRGLRTSSVSRGAKPRPVLTSSSRSPPGGAPSSRRYRPGAKVVILPLTLSFALFAEQSLRERSRDDRLRPPRRQAPRSSPVQSAFHRRHTQCRSLARCVAEQCLRFLQPLRSTSTASDRLKPHRSSETSPCGDAVLRGFAPSDDRCIRAGWRLAPCGVTPTELRWNRTRSARAAQVPPIHVAFKGLR